MKQVKRLLVNPSTALPIKTTRTILLFVELQNLYFHPLQKFHITFLRTVNSKMLDWDNASAAG